jgi:hypothetical protein
MKFSSVYYITIQYFCSACIPIDLVPQPQLENHLHNGWAAFDSYYCDYGTVEHENIGDQVEVLFHFNFWSTCIYMLFCYMAQGVDFCP